MGSTATPVREGHGNWDSDSSRMRVSVTPPDQQLRPVEGEGNLECTGGEEDEEHS